MFCRQQLHATVTDSMPLSFKADFPWLFNDQKLKRGHPVLAKILTLDAAKIQEALDCFCAKILQWKQWHFAKRNSCCTLAIWQLVMQLVYCTLMMLQWRWTRVQLYIAKFSFYTCLICVLTLPTLFHLTTYLCTIWAYLWYSPILVEALWWNFAW